MYSFLGGLVILILGYMIYGAVVNKIFGPDDRQTPCVAHPDGVDFVPISAGRAFLIQLLNIAGLGPIFGALTGAIWGPQVYLWIVFGTIFAGAVHDYMVGMLSMRNDGASVSEITGKYLGGFMLQVMRLFSVVLLVMVGVVFMVGPAGLLALMVTQGTSGAVGAAAGAAPATAMGYTAAEWTKILTVVILVYYFLATLLPIDKVIGKIYPVFGLCLIFMAIGIGGVTVYNHIQGTKPMIELWEGLYNMHPKADSMPIWPLMFITVACGAISGFHATQSPLMARCLTSERQGRFVFYGAMVAEGIIALIWASAGIAFYNATDGGFSTAGLLAVGGGNSTSVYQISVGLLGPVGSILALLGVVACPITSGDTAFRSARLTLADWFKIDQKGMAPRLLLALPLLGAGYAISFLDYGIVWRYFSWSNQTLAMIALWAGAVYLCNNVSAGASLMAAVPATFMSAVSVTYFCIAPECYLMLERNLAYGIGIGVAVLFALIFYFRTYRKAA
ncbi:MAG: carbon starvation protein A [Synergistaceae bacterium]|nr:carbon starvation protein A [Synergistaceae bacterium]MBQ9574493.1 carbon starvation protein A [Synergistaceae bacterium]